MAHRSFTRFYLPPANEKGRDFVLKIARDAAERRPFDALQPLWDGGPFTLVCVEVYDDGEMRLTLGAQRPLPGDDYLQAVSAGRTPIGQDDGDPAA